MTLVLWLSACRPAENDVDTTIFDPNALAGNELLGSLMGEDATLFISDREGNFIWDKEGEPGILNPVIQVDRSGQWLLYNEFAEDRSVDVGSIKRVGTDGEVRENWRTEQAHHTFVELPDGVFAYLAVDIRDTPDHGTVVGDRIVEVHPDGSTFEVFNIWNDLEVVEHDDWESDFYPQGHDWTHGNALWYDEEIDGYLVSFRNLSAIYELQRENVNGVWQAVRTRTFGGDESDYVIDPPEAEFRYPHGVHWTSDRTILLTSTNEWEGVEQTWASEFLVDDSTGTLTEIWNYGRGEELYAYALGEARRYENGNTLVNFGTAGVLHEVDAEGGLVWAMETDVGQFFGRTHLAEDLSALQPQ